MTAISNHEVNHTSLFADRSKEAYQSLKNNVLKTQLIPCHWLSNEKRSVWLKLECQQLTGSFKIRGAYNALFRLAAGSQVLTASAGNHGLALATAAKELGLKARIFVPLSASEIKIRRLTAMGAEIVVVGQDVAEAAQEAKFQATLTGAHYISPFDHEEVVVGQGSIAYEIAEQAAPVFDHALIPFGGGGLLSGFGCSAKKLWPDIKIHGVYPEIFNRNLTPRFQEHEMTKKVVPTLADGLAIQHEDGNWLWTVIKSLDSRFQCVTENEIKSSMLTLLTQESLLCEGAGAISLAPLLDPACDLTGNILVILSGGNVTPATLTKALLVDMTDSTLRKMNGLRNSELGVERSVLKDDTPKQDNQSANSGVTSGQSADHAEFAWHALINRLQQESYLLLEIFDRHESFIKAHSLNESSSISYIKRAIELLDNVCEVDDTRPEKIRERYRLAIQLYGFAKTALSWSSASTDQSGEVMFFDPAELQTGAVNYDRYGGPLLREKELTMINALGFDAEQNTLLMTSSGQAAYSTIESFLLREVLAPGAMIVTAPYIYFEAFEQLSQLPHIQVHQTSDWSVESMIHAIETHNARVAFIDPVANIAQMPTFDFAELARQLSGRDWSHRWLVIDGTMISSGFNPFALFDEPGHPHILYYESGSKYLQLGLDLQMTGVVVSKQQQGAELARHRRNLGSGLYQAQVARFPVYDRSDLLARQRLLTRNAQILIAELETLCSSDVHINVAYPKYWAEMGWQHGGGVVAMTFKEEGLNNRPCLDALIEKIIERCRTEHLGITQGVSFGFGTTRVSAAAAIAAETDPFLRFSVGEEAQDTMTRLSQSIAQTLIEFCQTMLKETV